jgi:hypothetical protein
MTIFSVEHRERVFMTPQEQVQFQLKNLALAEDAIRDNLHMHGIDPVAREHLNRAIAHVREAFIASKGIDEARSVQGLVRDLDAFERLLTRAKVKTPSQYQANSI